MLKMGAFFNMRAIINEIKNSVLRPQVLIAILFVVFINYISMKEELAYLLPYDPEGFGSVMYLSSFYLNGPLTVLVILASIFLSTNSFIDEYKSGYFMYKIERSGVMVYTLSKVLAMVFTAGLIVFIGTMLTSLILSTIFPIDFFDGHKANYLKGFLDLAKEKPISYLLLASTLKGLGCGVWGLFSILLACLTRSRYMSLIGPIFILILSTILSNIFHLPLATDLFTGAIRLEPYSLAFIVSLSLILILAGILFIQIKKIIRRDFING